MLKLALRDTRASALRLLLSVVAVLLGVSFVSGTFSLRNIMSSTFSDIIDTGYKAAAYVTPESGTGSIIMGTSGEPVIPLDLATSIGGFEGVAAAVPDLSGQVILVGADGTAVTGSGGAPSLGFGANPDDPTLVVSEGEAPRNSSEVVLETSTAERAGLSIGDSTRIIANGEIYGVTVTGLATYSASLAGATLVMLDGETAEKVFAPTGTVGLVSVYSPDQFTPDGIKPLSSDAENAFVASVSEQLSGVGGENAADGPSTPGSAEAEKLKVISGSQVREDAVSQTNEMVGFMSTFLLIFAALALFVGAFVIANTFAMTVRQKQREFALLRAVGASPGQVFSVVVVQAAVVGLIGGALGVLGGFGLVQGLRAVFRSFGIDMSGNLILTPPIVALGLVLGVAVAIASAAIAARRAALTPPVEAMRESEAPSLGTSALRGVVGIAMVGVGALVLAFSVAVVRSNPDAGVGLPFGIGAGLLLIGALVVSPIIAPGFVRVLSAPFLRATRPVGKLASGNIARNPKRTAATSGALTVGMALVAAAAVLAASTTSSMKSLVTTELKADFIVQSATFTISQQAFEQISALDEVGDISRFSGGEVRIPELTASEPDTPASSASGTDAKTLQIGATEPSTFSTTWTTTVIEGSLDSLARGDALVQKSVAKDNGWSVGDALTLEGAAGTTTARVGAIFDSAALGAPLIISTDLLDKLVPAQGQQINSVMVNAVDGVSTSQLRTALTEVAAPYMVLSVMDAKEFTSMLTGQVNQMLAVLYGLLALSLIIAALGIMNTLGLSVVERTREIGLLRAVGLGRGQLSVTFIIESVLTALFGTAVGLVVGVGIAAGVPSLLAGTGLNTLSIPWSALFAMLGLAVVVGVVAALWPAWRASRLPVLEAIAAVE